MIKIFDKLWYVKTVHKYHDNQDLAYMCQVDKTLKNKITTACNWAGVPVAESSGETIDNQPMSGFYIGSSVCRWSTSNKLFRVKDPRGFIVEVPTDNIATLLHHCTVRNGVVEEMCVWGREGSTHILLPINSQVFIDAAGNPVDSKDYLPVSVLQRGATYKIAHQGKTYDASYLGRESEITIRANKHEVIKDSYVDPANYNRTSHNGNTLESKYYYLTGANHCFMIKLAHGPYSFIRLKKPNIIKELQPFMEKSFSIREWEITEIKQQVSRKWNEVRVPYGCQGNTISVSPVTYEVIM